MTGLSCKFLRMKMGLTQEELCRVLGMSQPTLSRLENIRGQLSRRDSRRIRLALGKLGDCPATRGTILPIVSGLREAAAMVARGTEGWPL